MPPLRRGIEEVGSDLPPLKKAQTQVEKHDSLFDRPTVLFRTFPHNDTFVEHR